MSHHSLFFGCSLLLLVACSGGTQQPAISTPVVETPKALENSQGSFGISKRSSNSDLLEELYQEQVNKNPDLDRFEGELVALNGALSDTIEPFETYIRKNQDYFTATQFHIKEIKDSVLKRKMESLVAAQLAKFENSIIDYKELRKRIARGQNSISELHEVLKITRTLPLMENYQKEKLPKTKPVEAYLKKQEKVKQLADSLIGKQY